MSMVAALQAEIDLVQPREVVVSFSQHDGISPIDPLHQGGPNECFTGFTIKNGTRPRLGGFSVPRHHRAGTAHQEEKSY